MDDLDRLFFELVETLRRERPAAVKEPVAVHELHDDLVSYRRVRNSVGFRSNDDYQTTLCRLLSGERGYMLGDQSLQDELLTGLNEAIPDIRRYLTLPDNRVWVNPEQIPPPGDIRYAPPGVRERVEEQFERDTAAAISESIERQAPTTMPDRASSFSAEREDEPEVDARSEPPAIAVESQIEVVESVAGSIEPTRAETENDSFLGPAEDDSALSCDGCGAQLTERFSFCPFCGRRVLEGECASCGRTLEPAWEFCADCGAARGARPD